MNAFIMHIGSPGNVDVQYTITGRRNLREIYGKLAPSTLERKYFDPRGPLSKIFPDGDFNCWGVPSRAKPAFDKTEVGDVVLFVPSLEEGVKQMGIVKEKCPFRCDTVSPILWPATPNQRLFPFIYFFNTEEVDRGWSAFLDDLMISPNWQPRGWYKKLRTARFTKWGGVEGYVEHLRNERG